LIQNAPIAVLASRFPQIVIESPPFAQSFFRMLRPNSARMRNQGLVMTRIFGVAVALVLFGVMGTAPAQADAGRSLPPAGRAVAVAAPATPAIRHLHAVLRYDMATASACRKFSDTSSELCLLLALHVIRMSEKPLPGGAL
jgi:hypothetical protein